MRFPVPLLAITLVCALPLAACGDGVDNARISVVAIAADTTDGDLTIGRLPLGEGAGLLRAATAQGLVSFDADGRINPALAERWITSEDGLSYIFRLGDSPWNGGDPVSARQVATVLRQRLSELRRGGFSGDLSLVADVQAITDRVLEIRLIRPRPNLLELLAQPEFGIVRGKTGSGPMRARATATGIALQHRRFALEDGAEERVPPVVTLRSRRAATAIAAFAAGEADVVEGGRFNDLPLLAAAKIDAPAVGVDPVGGLFGLMVVERSGFLADPDNRAAIAMAIDREALTAAFQRGDWPVRLSAFPADLFGDAALTSPPWTGADLGARRQEAARRIAAWSAAQEGARPTVRIAVPAGAGGRILFARIADDLDAVGLSAARTAPDADADLRLIDRVADYDGPLWYLRRLTCPAAALCNKTAEALIERALEQPTLRGRRALLRDAAEALESDAMFIPLAAPLRFTLVRPGVAGHVPNARGWHLLQYLGGGPIS